MATISGFPLRDGIVVDFATATVFAQAGIVRRTMSASHFTLRPERENEFWGHLFHRSWTWQSVVPPVATYTPIFRFSDDWAAMRQMLISPPSQGEKMRSNRGFTLIELLIVVVVIGILASIAVPKFATTKEKAYVASMKSDLRNLVTAQEAYFADHVTYTATVTNLDYLPGSQGNTVEVTQGNGTGWAATAVSNATSKTCGIFVGTATLNGMDTPHPEGVPICIQ